MNTNQAKLKRRIMRRVYYIFAVRVIQHPLMLKLGLFAAALLVFAHMVHVHRILVTLLDMPVRYTPKYIFNAFMHGEALTLIAIGAMVFVALSFPRELRQLYDVKFGRGVMA